MFCRIDNQNRLCLPLDILRKAYPETSEPLTDKINIFVKEESLINFQKNGFCGNLELILSFEDLSSKLSSKYCFIANALIDEKGRFTFPKFLRNGLGIKKDSTNFVFYVKAHIIYLVYRRENI